MSRSVASCLKTYREDEELNDVPLLKRKFKNTMVMENLFELLDESFNVMNARCPKDGINEKKWEKGEKVS